MRVVQWMRRARVGRVPVKSPQATIVPAGSPLVAAATCTLTEYACAGSALKLIERAFVLAPPEWLVVSVPLPAPSWDRYVQPGSGAPVAAQLPWWMCQM